LVLNKARENGKKGMVTGVGMEEREGGGLTS